MNNEDMCACNNTECPNNSSMSEFTPTLSQPYPLVSQNEGPPGPSVSPGTAGAAQPRSSFWCREQIDAMTADVAAQRSTYLAPRMVVILLLVLLGVTALAAIGWVLLVFGLLD